MADRNISWLEVELTDRQSQQVCTSTHVRSTGIRTHDNYVNSFTTAERCAGCLFERQRHSLLCLWFSTLPSLLFRQFVLVTLFRSFFSYIDFFLFFPCLKQYCLRHSILSHYIITATALASVIMWRIESIQGNAMKCDKDIVIGKCEYLGRTITSLSRTLTMCTRVVSVYHLFWS